MVTTISDRGGDFIKAKEGWNSRAYLDSGRVVTIGWGFTNLDRISLDFFMTKWGRPLQLGDTITQAEGDKLFGRLMREEYSPPVLKRFGDKLTTAEFDAAGSVAYNAGAGALQDQWAEALARGDVAEASRLLRVDRVTVSKPTRHTVQGLVNRRAAEARLLQSADYGFTKVATIGDRTGLSTAPADVRVYQEQLAKLGIYKGPIDGLVASSARAVVVYQGRHPELDADGLVGPATRAALARDAQASAVVKVTPAVVVAVGGAVTIAKSAPAASAAILLPAAGILGAVAIVLVAAAAWHYREDIGRAVGRLFSR